MSIFMICKETSGYIYQIVSGGLPFAATCLENLYRPETFPFIATNNWTVLAVRWSVKYFFAPNSPIFQKSCGKEEEEGDWVVGNRKKRYAFQANAINVEWNKFALYNATLANFMH